MRYSEIRVGLKRTVNLGNYESASFEISLTADASDESVREGDPRLDEIVRYAYENAARLLTEERERRLGSRPANGVPARGKHAVEE